MSFWLIGGAAVVVLIALVLLQRRGRDDADAAVAATPLAAPSAEPATEGDAEEDVKPDPAAESPIAASVRAETLRSLQQLAFGVTLPPAPGAPPADELCASVATTLVNIVDKPNY